MIALLLDTWEWLRSEATSLWHDLLQKSAGRLVPRPRPHTGPDRVFALADLASEAFGRKTPRKPSGAAVTIELAPYECLRRPLTAIRLRASHLRSMAELDVATTPIDRGDVVILFEQRTGTSSDNAYFVIRTEIHTALCRMIAARRRSMCISVSAAGCRRYRENDR
jgi:hypothetical protein